MNKTSKFLATAAAAVALFFSTNVNAQSSPKFGIGLNLGAPTNNNYNLAIGGDLRYQFDINKQLSVPITTGYTRLIAKDASIYSDRGYVPVKVGLKYFLNDTGAGVYGLAEAGLAIGVGTYSNTDFLYAPAIGYAWSNGFDLAAKYEGFNDGAISTGYFGLRLAYGFKL